MISKQQDANPYESPSNTNARSLLTAIAILKRHETIAVIASTLLLAGLWGAVRYQSATFAGILLVTTCAIAVGLIANAIFRARWGILFSLVLLFGAVVFGEMVTTLFLVAAFGGTPIGFLFSIVRPTRANWRVVTQLVVMGALSVASMFLYVRLQRAGAERAARRGHAIVQALERYEKENGELPESLSQLVPGELESIPETGMVGFPEFKYVRAEDEKNWDVEFETYELRVDLYKFLQFDRLVYWPEGNYPDAMYGGGVERIGRWAYVHE